MVGAAIEAGMEPSQALALTSKDEIITHLRQMAAKGGIGGGDWLLVKGSRGVSMETITIT